MRLHHALMIPPHGTMHSFLNRLNVRSRECRFISRAFLLGILTLLCASESRGPSIEDLRAGGELRVALVSVPHTYSLEPGGILGFDYDLLREFCAINNLRLRVSMVDNRAQAKDLLIERKVHLAAGLIPVHDLKHPRLRFGPSYSMIQAQVIYVGGTRRPDTVEDLAGAKIETLAGDLGDTELTRLAKSHDNLGWRALDDVSTEQLLSRVNAGKINYAVVPSTDFMVLRLKYPRLEIGFALGDPYATAWGIASQSQLSLDRALIDFFVDSEKVGLRERLWDRYYGHYGEFDFVDAHAFLRGYNERFPTLRQYFLDAGSAVGIDWRLLAALSYQESHWNPDARSPTGVRGLMMLTARTAKQLQVSRLDPAESVTGGARYLADLLQRLPRSIVDDDRLWFALAAYNIGLGHIEDARVLTQTRGGDPNSWREVRRDLPLLGKPSIAAATRYGSAPGGQTVHFVTNFRRYFDAMRQLERLSDTPDNFSETLGADISNFL